MENQKIKRVLIKLKELLQWRFFDKQTIFSSEINYFSIEGYYYGGIKESKDMCWYSLNNQEASIFQSLFLK